MYKNLPEITIGNRIRKVRLIKNISQEEIQRATRIKSMDTYEFDVAYPSPNVIKKISEYLNTPLEYFYDDYYRFVFSNNLKLWRKNNNLTQVMASQVLNVDRKTYWQWENGVYMDRVSFEKIRKKVGA